MKQRIEAIKAECLRAIELTEAATPGPWHTDSARGVMTPAEMPVCYPFGTLEEEEKNAAHIANARTFTPKAARCLLAQIDMLEAGACWQAIDKLCDEWEGRQ